MRDKPLIIARKTLHEKKHDLMLTQKINKGMILDFSWMQPVEKSTTCKTTRQMVGGSIICAITWYKKVFDRKLFKKDLSVFEISSFSIMTI